MEPVKTRDYNSMLLLALSIITLAMINPCTAAWVPSMSAPYTDDSTDFSYPEYGQSASVTRSISMYTSDNLRVDTHVELETYVDIYFWSPNGGTQSAHPHANSATIGGVTWSWVGPPATSPATSLTENMYFGIELDTYAAADDSRGGPGQIDTVECKAWVNAGTYTSQPSYGGTIPTFWIESSATTRSQDGEGDYESSGGTWDHVSDYGFTAEDDYYAGWHQWDMDAWVTIDCTYGFSAGTSSISGSAGYVSYAECDGVVSVPAGLYAGGVYGTAKTVLGGYSDVYLTY